MVVCKIQFANAKGIMFVRREGTEGQRRKGETKSEKVKVKNVFEGKAQRHGGTEAQRRNQK